MSEIMNTSENSQLKPYINKYLKNPPDILEGFHHDDILDFLKVGIIETYQKGDTVVNKSDYVNSAYLLCEGQLSVWEENIELATLSENSFIGETFLFGDNNRMAKIVSNDNSILLRFQRHDMLFFFKKKPTKLFNIFTRNIIYVQQKKLQRMNTFLLKLKKQRLKDENKY